MISLNLQMKSLTKRRLEKLVFIKKKRLSKVDPANGMETVLVTSNETVFVTLVTNRV